MTRPLTRFSFLAATIASFALAAPLASPALAQSPSGDSVIGEAGSTPGLSAPRWTVYSDDNGTRVDIPESIFTVDAGAAPRGEGRAFQSADRRSWLLVYVEGNDKGLTPGRFVSANFTGSRAELDYNRVTDRFFAISGVNGNLVFYSRCNFAEGRSGPAHCIYLAYPKDEVRQWDRIVSRISLSLRPSR